MTEDVDIDDLTERAKILAEATGRSVEDVMADLLDDGILNDSHKQTDEPKDLVTQLKEAAALITTVQEINKEVSENKVLNGGNNKTAVAVETTLEGDIVDRAIASAQRKADNIKKLIATMIPVFLLLTGGSLEAFGVTDFVGSDDDPVDWSDEYGGCLASDADNYDPGASWDDGSCYWDGGGNGNDCYPDWWWQNEAIFDHDHDGQGFNNDLRVQVDFRDLNSCNQHMNNGYFEIMVGDEDRVLEYNFHDQFLINEHYLDLAPGDYYVTVNYYTYDGSSWAGPTAWVTMEGEPEQTTDCDMAPDVIPGTMDASVTGKDVVLHMDVHDKNGCEGQTIDVEIHYDLYWEGSFDRTVDGLWITVTGKDVYYHDVRIDGLRTGNWTVMPRIIPDGQPEQFYNEYDFQIADQ